VSIVGYWLELSERSVAAAISLGVPKEREAATISQTSSAVPITQGRRFQSPPRNAIPGTAGPQRLLGEPFDDRIRVPSRTLRRFPSEPTRPHLHPV
jgi:hypothetical protein